MESLEKKILDEGTVLPGHILKVGSFLNQQLDVEFLHEVGCEIARLYKDAGVTKVMTIESSGIAIATLAALELGVKAVVVKKSSAKNQSGDMLTCEIASFTHGNTYTATLAREYIDPQDVVLIVDDFLACGNALRGMLQMVRDAGAQLAGCAVAIEKKFQGGGDALRHEGIRCESLAMVESMDDHGLTFWREK